MCVLVLFVLFSLCSVLLAECLKQKSIDWLIDSLVCTELHARPGFLPVFPVMHRRGHLRCKRRDRNNEFVFLFEWYIGGQFYLRHVTGLFHEKKCPVISLHELLRSSNSQNRSSVDGRQGNGLRWTQSAIRPFCKHRQSLRCFHFTLYSIARNTLQQFCLSVYLSVCHTAPCQNCQTRTLSKNAER